MRFVAKNESGLDAQDLVRVLRVLCFPQIGASDAPEP